MKYRKDEKLQLLMRRKVNKKNVESIVEIFINTMKSIDMYNAIDSYMTILEITNWYHKKNVKNYPCITLKLQKIMDILYREIKWKSESKKRRLTTSMVFVNFNNEIHSIKEIYNMSENQQDPYYDTIIKRVKAFITDWYQPSKGTPTV